MKLIFLYGLPGVGKLTVGKALIARENYKLLHNHLVVDLAVSLFEFGSTEFSELREQLWLDVLNKAFSNNVEGIIFTFVYEKSVKRSFLNKLYRLIKKYAVDSFFVELKCSDTQLESRIVQESRKAFQKINDVEKYNKLKADGAFLELRIPPEYKRISIDTTSKSAEETADEILDLVKGF